MIVGLHGLPRAGKDAAAKTLVDEYGFIRMAFSSRLKEAAAILLNKPISSMSEGAREAIMPEWGFSVRYFLQHFGTEAMRNNFGKDFWVKLLSSGMTDLVSKGYSRFVITDVRFPNEAQFVRDHMGCLVEVVRPGIKHNDHISNQKLECDYTIQNDGILFDLAGRVRKFYKEVLL